MSPPPSAVHEVSNGVSQGTHEKQQNKVDKSMNRHTGGKVKMAAFSDMMPKFSDKYEEREYLKGRLATAFRIFGKLGFEEGVAGHITLRDPVNPSQFWVNPMGTSFRQIKRSDLILISEDGEVIDGGENRKLNSAAYMIHHAIHTARPDVMCAAHSHSIYGRAFSTLGRNLDITTQDACAFHNDLALYTQFNGIVLDEQEGIDISKALGDKKAAILSNHGLLTTGGSVEAAVFWFMSLEKCCHAQLLADAAAAGRGGKTVKINEEDAAYTYKTIGSELAGWFSAQPEFDVMLAEYGKEILS